jgi:predicted nucleic acid-binding protein
MICLDANLAAATVLPEGDTTLRARRLTRQWIADGVGFVAPDLWAYEVVSLAFRAVTRGRFSIEDGPAILQEMFNFPITLIRPQDYARAYEIALTHRLPAVCDAQYLAVAQANGIEFWTGNKKLYDRVHAALPWVHWLGEEGVRQKS